MQSKNVLISVYFVLKRNEIMFLWYFRSQNHVGPLVHSKKLVGNFIYFKQRKCFFSARICLLLSKWSQQRGMHRIDGTGIHDAQASLIGLDKLNWFLPRFHFEGHSNRLLMKTVFSQRHESGSKIIKWIVESNFGKFYVHNRKKAWKMPYATMPKCHKCNNDAKNNGNKIGISLSMFQLSGKICIRVSHIVTLWMLWISY